MHTLQVGRVSKMVQATTTPFKHDAFRRLSHSINIVCFAFILLSLFTTGYTVGQRVSIGFIAIERVRCRLLSTLQTYYYYYYYIIIIPRSSIRANNCDVLTRVREYVRNNLQDISNKVQHANNRKKYLIKCRYTVYEIAPGSACPALTKKKEKNAARVSSFRHEK